MKGHFVPKRADRRGTRYGLPFMRSTKIESSSTSSGTIPIKSSGDTAQYHVLRAKRCGNFVELGCHVDQGLNKRRVE